MRVLLIEDDDLLADAVSVALRKSGFLVEVAENGTAADNLLEMTEYDALILDLGLPEMDGLEVLKRLRGRRKATPVMVVTARDEAEDIIGALDVGADDYITKPFRLPVLEARLRALLRRAQWDSNNEITFAGLRYDIMSRRAFAGDEALTLSAKEVGILELLMRRAGRIVSKEQIARDVYDGAWDLNYNTIEVAVHRLRKKLEAAGLTVKTIRGLGYTLSERDIE